MQLVQEAACSERVVVLKIREPGRTAYVIVGGGGAGLLSPETRRAVWGGRLPAGSARQRAREDALVGAQVLAIGEREVFIEQKGAARVIRAERTRVVVTDAPPPAELGPQDVATLEARGEVLARALADDVLAGRRVDVARVLASAEGRIDRRRRAVLGDLDKIRQADGIASQAQWLIAEAARTPRGATELVVTDWSSGEAVPLRVPLDPSKSAKDQVAAMFKRAKRLRLGGKIAEERLAQTETQLAAIAGAKEEAGKAASLVALEEALQRAKRAAPRDVALPSTLGSSAKAEAPTRTAYRTFFARSGRRLLVGKGAADNDALTFHVGRPHDLWLHAKDRTGAHVIVSLEKGKTCPSEDLVDAAHLAAHFSEARDEAIVDVQYAQRRHLRKPKGSAPGFVIVDREKVLVLRVDAALVKTLLEAEA